MSSCITIGGQCSCLKIRVKWCDKCQKYICRIMYKGHIHMTAEERELWRVHSDLRNILYYRIYQLEEETAVKVYGY